MKRSLTNRLYLKQWLYTLKIKEGTLISEHLDEFNKIIMDLDVYKRQELSYMSVKENGHEGQRKRDQRSNWYMRMA